MDLCNVSDTTMCIRMNHLGTKERWCLIGSTNHMDVQSWLRTPVGRGNADKTKKMLINKGKFTSPQIKFIYLILSQTSYSQQIHRSTYILLEKQVKFNIPVRQVLLFYTERNTILLLFLYGGNRPQSEVLLRMATRCLPTWALSPHQHAGSPLGSQEGWWQSHAVGTVEQHWSAAWSWRWDPAAEDTTYKNCNTASRTEEDLLLTKYRAIRVQYANHTYC